MKIARRIAGIFAIAFIGLTFLTSHQADASGAALWIVVWVVLVIVDRARSSRSNQKEQLR